MSPAASWDLLVSFTRANILGFGGGPSVIPFIKAEVTNRHRWLSDDEFTSALAVGNTLPGPIATKLAAYIGFKVAGVLGATMALLGTVVPSGLAMVLLFSLLMRYQDHPFVKGCIRGVKPVIWVLFLLLVLEYVKFIGSKSTGLFAVAAFTLIYLLQVHPVYVIVGSMILGGALLGR